MQDAARIPHSLLSLLTCAAVGSLAAGGASAGGVGLYEIGTKDVGLASAGYGARAEDASTVLTNPAGMTRLPGTQTLAGVQLLYGDVGLSLTPTADTASGGDGGNPIGALPGGGVFVTHEMSNGLTVGFGFGSNFGLAEKYDSDWAGRYYGQKATLAALSFLPSVAWRATDKLSFGVAFNVMYGILDAQVAVNNIVPSAADGKLNVGDRTWGAGVNVGMLYELSTTTRLGLTYNSQVNLDFSAPAEFSGLASGLDNLLSQRGLKGAQLDLGIKVPQGLMASVSHEVNDRWTVLGSLGWQQWSRFGYVEVGVASDNPTTLTQDLHFKDTWHGALGAEFRPQSGVAYHVGIAYDSAFQDGNNVSPLLPANSAWRFGVGTQRQSGPASGWGLAAEYVYGGTLGVNKLTGAPVALGGRGDLVGRFNDTGIIFLAANFTWK
jgi:long-chain fatty acid transport protein